ncbi:MAG: ABC transporter ATP-binding protein, partial [Bifidobacterium psychraerophilum]
HIRKSYGGVNVLGDVDLRVEYGEILALLGRNGAGKSTLVSIACGLEQPDSGEIRTGGMIPSSASRSAFGRCLGLAPQSIGVYPQLTVLQNLLGFALLYGLSTRAAHQNADETIDMLAQRNLKAERLSGGQQRRLHTGIALVHRPKILFLDEATVGADVETRASILRTVRSVAESGTAVIYTTHYLEEVEALDAHVAFLVDGSISDSGSLRRVVASHASPSIRVRFEGSKQPRVTGWHRSGDYLEADVPAVDSRGSRGAGIDPGQTLAVLLRDPHCCGRVLADVDMVRPDLESAYLNIVGSDSEQREA